MAVHPTPAPGGLWPGRAGFFPYVLLSISPARQMPARRATPRGRSLSGRMRTSPPRSRWCHPVVKRQQDCPRRIPLAGDAQRRCCSRGSPLPVRADHGGSRSRPSRTACPPRPPTLSATADPSPSTGMDGIGIASPDQYQYVSIGRGTQHDLAVRAMRRSAPVVRFHNPSVPGSPVATPRRTAASMRSSASSPVSAVVVRSAADRRDDVGARHRGSGASRSRAMAISLGSTVLRLVLRFSGNTERLAWRARFRDRPHTTKTDADDPHRYRPASRLSVPRYARRTTPRP